MKKPEAKRRRRPSLKATLREADRGLEEIDRRLRQVDLRRPDAHEQLLELALAHARLWNKHAPRLGLPLAPDPDAPEGDDL